ncbi:hypothetical protein HPB47_021493, partial [Ixodes persulcatus]
MAMLTSDPQAACKPQCGPEATTLQQENLSAADETLESLASNAMNPSAMTVCHWCTAWQQQPYGQPVNPILSWVIRPNYLQH